MIKFDKLWGKMKERGITQYQLINDFDFSRGQLDRIKQNGNITIHTIDVLCNILHCDVDEIMEHIDDGRIK